jgi:hypothetical protein
MTTMELEFISVKIGGHSHRIAQPVAEELGIEDGAMIPDGDEILDRVIELNRQLMNAQSDKIRSLASIKTGS